MGREYRRHDLEIYTKYHFGSINVKDHLVDLCVDGTLVLTEY
jgi:hypothetical protein